MTTHNTISDSMIDGDSIAIDDIFFYLRDNPIAALEGNAPYKMSPNAVEDVTAGDYEIKNYYVSDTGVAAYSWRKDFECRAIRAGTYRTKMYISRSGSGEYKFRVRVYKNGVAFGTLRDRDGTPTDGTFTEDLTFAKGDLIQLYTDLDSVSNITLNFSLGVANPIGDVCEGTV